MEVIALLSQTDAWDLMTAIKHIDHRSVTREDAVLFAQIVNDACDPSLRECVKAVGQWFGTHHDFGMIQPGDVADIVKRNRPAARLTRNDIDTALINAGMEGDGLWLAAREIPRLVNQGIAFGAAVARMADKWCGRELEAPEREPRKQVGHHFAGRVNLQDVIGATE